MTIDGIRPAVMGSAAHDDLDELRRFRHLFRAAYRLELNSERLALVHRAAQSLETSYTADLMRFTIFLDTLAQDTIPHD